MSKAADVVIVGAGIVGAACARALAREGLRVTIVDAGTVGGGATAAAMGHIVVMDDSPAQLALTRYSQQLWRDLVAELPPDCQYDPCGTLWVAVDDEELAAARAKEQSLRRHNIPAELLDSRQLGMAEPNLRAGLAGGLFQPDDLVIKPLNVAWWLVEQARLMGTNVRFDSPVKSLSGDRVLLADGSRLGAGSVINAAGMAAARLTPGLPIRPRKGHLALFDCPCGFVRHQLVELGYAKSAAGAAAESVAFNVQPRRAEQLLVGSSRQYDRETDEVETAILDRMLRRAIDYLPGLGQLGTTESWTGLRASTDDKLPLIGPWPEAAGVYLATGHEGLGITMSLGTAELLADMIVGRKSKIPRKPYLPERMVRDC